MSIKDGEGLRLARGVEQEVAHRQKMRKLRVRRL
jgi:hypothetical protein